jgi:hypothetical protein
MIHLSRLLLPLALLLGLAAPSAALAQTKPPQPRPPATAQPRPQGASPQAAAATAPETVNLQLMVVHAKAGETFLDPRLKGIERHLKLLPYDSFKVLSTDKAVLRPGKAAEFPVEGGRQVKATLLSADEAKAQVRVEVYKGGEKLVDTTVSVNRGSTFMVGGPRHDGGILLLPITANY